MLGEGTEEESEEEDIRRRNGNRHGSSPKLRYFSSVEMELDLNIRTNPVQSRRWQQTLLLEDAEEDS